MKKLVLSLIALICIIFSSSNVFASEILLHKQGKSSVGMGYSSLTPSGLPGIPAMSGINLDLTYGYTDNFAMALKAAFLSGSTSTISATLNPFIIQGEWHGAFTDKFGYYAGVGYATSPGSRNNVSTNDTGITYDGGLEYKFINNIIGNIEYQYIGLTIGSMNGISGGVNYTF